MEISRDQMARGGMGGGEASRPEASRGGATHHDRNFDDEARDLRSFGVGGWYFPRITSVSGRESG